MARTTQKWPDWSFFPPTQQFYDAYHAKVPKEEGFEGRERVYQLYHFVNQLNLFSDKQVRGKCLDIMREIAGSG